MFQNETDALKYYFENVKANERVDGKESRTKRERVEIDLEDVFVSLDLSQKELDVLFLTVVKKFDYWKAAKALSEKYGRKFSADEVFALKSRLVYRVKKELFNFGLLMFLR
jgi:hypothetical protein